jgi:hypothetical protein
MPFTPPDWGRVRISLDVLRAELLIFEWAARETNDPALTEIVEGLRATIAKMGQHPQIQAQNES